MPLWIISSYFFKTNPTIGRLTDLSAFQANHLAALTVSQSQQDIKNNETHLKWYEFKNIITLTIIFF